MTERERKSMLRVAVLLLGAAVIRFIFTDAGAADPPLQGRPSIADSLIRAGDSAVAEKERRGRPLAEGEKIDPNLAGEEELDRLPGVGKSKALLIVQERETNGPFASVDELARVQGIGPRTVERLRPFLELRASPSAGSRSLGQVPFAAGGANGDSPTGREGVRSGVASPINLNRATAEELQQLPGIGPVVAARIVALRMERGGFAVPEELMEVKGIGAKTFSRLAPFVTTGR